MKPIMQRLESKNECSLQGKYNSEQQGSYRLVQKPVSVLKKCTQLRLDRQQCQLQLRKTRDTTTAPINVLLRPVICRQAKQCVLIVNFTVRAKVQLEVVCVTLFRLLHMYKSTRKWQKKMLLLTEFAWDHRQAALQKGLLIAH